MSSRWDLPERAYINEADFDGDGAQSENTGSIWLGPCHRISIHEEWNQDSSTDQDLAATKVIEASNDPRARPDHFDHANAKWDDVTSRFTDNVDPTTGAGDNEQSIENFNPSFIRITITGSSGSGDYVLYLRASE